MPVGGLPGEFELIERYFKPLASAPGAFGLADDVAVIQPGAGEELVLKVDTLVEGVHFFADDPPEGIAAKALRINLSDLASKGAEARGYLLALSLRSDWTEAWVAGFARGLAADQTKFGMSLLGGDTTRASGETTVSITAIGAAPKGKLVRRSGARPGDVVFVSGTIGDAALGLRVRRKEFDQRVPGAEHLLRRYMIPEPRVALAPVLLKYASAALDVSDGLIGDFGHICRESGVTGTIEAGLVPLSPPAQRLVESQPEARRWVLTGGDDYEVLATVPEGKAASFEADSKEAGVAVARIGRVAAGSGPPMALDEAGNPLSYPGLSFDHFRTAPE